MANVNTINFGGLSNADLQAQQLDLQRRQQYADMLRQQALTPIQQQQVSGRVVKTSPVEGLAKLAMAYFSNKSQTGLDQKQAELGEAGRKRAADALRSLAPAGVFDDAPLSATPQMSGPGDAQIDSATKQAWIRALKVSETNPELGNKLIQNLAELTNDQKNNAAEGVNPLLAGALRTAKMRKDGTIEFQPGTTSKDLATGIERFQPKLGEGIMPAPGGGAQAIPGYGQAAAGIAGQQAQAQAAANAGFQLKEITGPDGVPRMLTAQQAAQMAQGGQAAPGTQGMPVAGPPNAGFPPGTQIPAPTPGPSRLDILLQEQQKMAADPRTDPRDMAAINREVASAGGGQQPAMPGIPMQSEAQRAAQIGAVENQLALDKSLRLNAQSPEAQQKVTDAGSVLGLVSAAEPLLAGATGSTVGALRDSAMSVFGRDTDASKAAAQLKVIGGQLVSKMPKMSGPQSDKDVQLYREMAGQIGDPTVTSGNKAAALQTIRQLNEKYLSQNQGSMPAAAARAVQGAAPASIDDLLKKYGGQ